MLVGVDPGEEAGDVVEFGEVDDCLIELYLAAPDELALEYPVIHLLVQHLLPRRYHRLSVFIQHCIEVSR